MVGGNGIFSFTLRKALPRASRDWIRTVLSRTECTCRGMFKMGGSCELMNIVCIHIYIYTVLCMYMYTAILE